jgi:hypothetical protein
MGADPGTDLAFLIKGTEYYLDVVVANTSWTVKIEEER